jgi:hypothetical protein
MKTNWFLCFVPDHNCKGNIIKEYFIVTVLLKLGIKIDYWYPGLKDSVSNEVEKRNRRKSSFFRFSFFVLHQLRLP